MRIQQMIKENEKRQDEVANKRAAEWAAREDKIKNAMSRMADTVVKKNNAAEKEMERRLIAQALEQDKRDDERDRQKKEAAFKRDLEIRRTLSK